MQRPRRDGGHTASTVLLAVHTSRRIGFPARRLKLLNSSRKRRSWSARERTGRPRGLRDGRMGAGEARSARTRRLALPAFVRSLRADVVFPSGLTARPRTRVPQHNHVDDDAECVELVFLAFTVGAALLRRGVFALFMGLFARGCVSPVLLSGGQQPSQRVPVSFRRPAEPRNGAEHLRSCPRPGALPSEHSRGVLVRCRGKGGRPAMAVTTGFQRRTFDVPQTGVPCIDLPSRAPCAAADAVFADAKAFLSSSEARLMSESELERELHRRRQDLVRKLLQGHRDQRSPKEAAGPAEDTSGVECSEPHEHESHAETTSGTMQVVGLGCARRGHDGLHRLDAALNLLPERYLVEMGRRVTITTASRAPPCTPWKPQWYSTSSTWQRRRGVRCSSSAHRRACRHLVRDPMGVDRRTVTLGCSCGGSQPPQAAGALMRTETSHEAREDQRKSPLGR